MKQTLIPCHLLQNFIHDASVSSQGDSIQLSENNCANLEEFHFLNARSHIHALQDKRVIWHRIGEKQRDYRLCERLKLFFVGVYL